MDRGMKGSKQDMNAFKSKRRQTQKADIPFPLELRGLFGFEGLQTNLPQSDQSIPLTNRKDHPTTPIGAWKCNFQPILEIMTDRPTDQPNDQQMDSREHST